MQCRECKCNFEPNDIKHYDAPVCPICLSPITCQAVPEPPPGQLEQDTHAGFLIRCRLCGSFDVGIDSTVGFSCISGSWGGVYLRCAVCHATVEVFEA